MLQRSLFISVLLFYTCLTSAQSYRFSYTQSKMGSPCSITFYTDDTLKAGRLANACFHLVDSLAAIFTDYDDSSELNQLCNRIEWMQHPAQPVKVSPALFDILLQSREAYEKSGGRFDITLAPVTRLWRKARQEKRFPSDSMVKEKLALTGFSKVRLDTVLQTVVLLKPGMQLDLGGIAQGYIAQKITDFLQQHAIKNVLADVSGDIVTIGAPPGTTGWKIGISLPESRDRILPGYLSVSNCAVTTSGDAYRFMEHEGKRYSHVIDPATGYGVTSQRNVTVIAAEGSTADWLTKACSLLPIRKALKLARQMQAEVLITEMKKDKPVMYASRGFKKYWYNAVK